MFWNRKKKNSDDGEEDLYEYTGETEESEDESGLKSELFEEDSDLEYTDDEDSFDDEDCSDEEDNSEEEDGEEYFDESDAEEFFEEAEEGDTEDETASVTVTARVTSLNSLAEFISLRAAGTLQFMRKGSDEVFELREYHLRIAKVWGSVSMSRECSAAEYAKIMLALELTESPKDFHVLPALTENDIKQAVIDFCEEKYDEKSKKYANNLKKFAKFIDSNGDTEEWRLFLKELLYKKTEDFCNENAIIFSETPDIDEADGVEGNE